MKKLHPLEVMALSGTLPENEKKRIEWVASITRAGGFGYFKGITITVSTAREIINGLAEPRGRKAKIAEQLVEEYRRQNVLARERKARQEVASAYSTEGYFAVTALPRGDWLSKDTRRGMLRKIRLIREATAHRPKQTISILASYTRDNKHLGYSHEAYLLIEILLGKKIKAAVVSELGKQNNRIRQRAQRLAIMWSSDYRCLAKRKEMSVPARARELVILSLRKRKVATFDGDNESWGDWMSAIIDCQFKNGDIFMTAKPNYIMVESNYRHTHSYDHTVRFLVYVLKNGARGRLRINVEGDLNQAFDVIQSAALKKKIKKGYKVEINWEEWGFYARHPKRKKEVFHPFKLAEHRGSPYPSYGVTSGGDKFDRDALEEERNPTPVLEESSAA